MNILKSLSKDADYSKTQLQWILAGWVISSLTEKKKTISLTDGDVSEDDYDKQSIYSLLYALYRSMGEVKDEHGTKYEWTFNTWGYAWPSAWGPKPVPDSEPQRFGRNAYTGLYHFEQVKNRVKELNGKVNIVEMGCGTGAGAHHVTKTVFPECTYEAVDMQQAAIKTCKRKFVPELNGRLKATWANATQLSVKDASADFVAVNETHVTEMPGIITDEDKMFFNTMYRILKPNGYFVWGNAIPEITWKPCFDYLESIGMKVIEVCDVTKEAVIARDEDMARVKVFCEDMLNSFWAFKIPGLGKKRRLEAELALKNFYRDPGTNLYRNMVDGTDTYKVALLQKIK